MPKFKVDQYDKKHRQNLTRLAMAIKQLFSEYTTRVAGIGAGGTLDSREWFLFENDKVMNKRVDEAMAQLHDDIIRTTEEAEWKSVDLSVEKCEAMIDYYGSRTLLEIRRGISPRSFEALKAFQRRKTNGINLSDRVWNITTQFKQELELALECGISDGIPAMKMARELRMYLNEPNKLFRRVRDKETGLLRLSKNAEAYHHGQGVYRSSSRNAQRLAVTETNMAYRESDHTNWKQFDFVIGIKVQTSQSNHEIGDMCDELAGVYPPTFKFTGWHPFCRCHAVPIMKTREEMRADDDRILRGEAPLPSKNEIKQLPENYVRWIQNNDERLERLEKRGKLPYFVKENNSMKLLK